MPHRVSFDRHVAELPVAVHLVADTPPLDAVRLWMPLSGPARSPESRAAAVDVFQLLKRLLQSPQAGVDHDQRFGLELAAKLQEFVDAEVIVFDALPGAFPARRSAVPRTDAVFPVISGYEVAAWPAVDACVRGCGGDNMNVVNLGILFFTLDQCAQGESDNCSDAIMQCRLLGPYSGDPEEKATAAGELPR